MLYRNTISKRFLMPTITIKELKIEENQYNHLYKKVDNGQYNCVHESIRALIAADLQSTKTNSDYFLSPSRNETNE